MTTPPTFGLSNCSDLLEELRGTVSDLKKDPVNPRLARYAAIVAWSMCDWVEVEKPKQIQKDKIEEKCPALKYMQDLANTFKHGEPWKPEHVKLSAAYRTGGFGRGFSRDFDIVRLELVLKDGSRLWFEDVIQEALDFWNSFLREENLIPTKSQES